MSKSRKRLLNSALIASALFLLSAVVAPPMTITLKHCGDNTDLALTGAKCSPAMTLLTDGIPFFVFSSIAITLFVVRRRAARNAHAAGDCNEYLPIRRYPWITFMIALALVPVGRVDTLHHRGPYDPRTDRTISSGPPTWTTTRPGLAIDLLVPHRKGSTLRLYKFFWNQADADKGRLRLLGWEPLSP